MAMMTFKHTRYTRELYAVKYTPVMRGDACPRHAGGHTPVHGMASEPGPPLLTRPRKHTQEEFPPDCMHGGASTRVIPTHTLDSSTMQAVTRKEAQE